MGCGCKKDIKMSDNTNNNFRKEEIKQESNGITKKLNMIQSFASALTSRGLKNEKVSKATKQLRVLSCFGNKDAGGVLPACEHLKQSSTPGKHFCGGCGCGDRKGTWLVAEGDEYSKLDYPKLNCPLHMPGFTNYTPATADEAVSPITRRHYIENMQYKDIEKVKVNIFDPPPTEDKK
jgi:hypothetical protein